MLTGTSSSESTRSRRDHRPREAKRGEITPRERVSLRKLAARAQAGPLTRKERARMEALVARERRAVEAEAAAEASPAAVAAGINGSVNGTVNGTVNVSISRALSGEAPTMPSDEQVQGAIRLLDPANRRQGEREGQGNGGKTDDGDVECSFGEFGENDSKDGEDGGEDSDADGSHGAGDGEDSAKSIARTAVMMRSDSNDEIMARTLAVSNFGDTPVILQVSMLFARTRQLVGFVCNQPLWWIEDTNIPFAVLT